MKKASFLVMALFFAVLCNFSASAQVEYTWDDYNLKFSVPSDFKESASDGDHFEGSSNRGKIYLFGLYPIKDENVTTDNLAEAVNAMAKESKMKVEETMELDFNGFQGYCAEGTIEGKPAFFACMLDPNGDLNFIITVLHDNADAAINLIKSIKKK
jgi:hypothetical protein